MFKPLALEFYAFIAFALKFYVKSLLSLGIGTRRVYMSPSSLVLVSFSNLFVNHKVQQKAASDLALHSLLIHTVKQFWSKSAQKSK